jgi:flagellar biosynthesis protein FlhG
LNGSLKPFAGRPPENGKLIAVGGAKGGIGKSLFSVNLAVLLSQMGFRTVIADLDLGGANLHLYLGERKIDRVVNQYLNKQAGSLEEIMIETSYGPLLIGGDSSELGAANIGFSRKLKLLRALKNLEADYVIADLGGDISFNILDFFLAADYTLVLCTPEPAAYLDAYRFIKVALYRKLARLFGVESEFQPMKDLELEELIQRVTSPDGESSIKRIDQLLEVVRDEQPHNMKLLTEAIESFRPLLILNRVSPSQDPEAIVNTVRNVSEKMLSLNVDYLGSIPYSPELERSAMELVPLVAKYPDGELAQIIREIIS